MLCVICRRLRNRELWRNTGIEATTPLDGQNDIIMNNMGVRFNPEYSKQRGSQGSGEETGVAYESSESTEVKAIFAEPNNDSKNSQLAMSSDWPLPSSTREGF